MRVDQLVATDTISCACGRYSMVPRDGAEWQQAHATIADVEREWNLTFLPWQHAYIVSHVIGAPMILFNPTAVGKTTAMTALLEVLRRMGR